MKEINIHHDGTLDIATGRSRKETRWKNTELQWSELLERLATTHRTHETHKEYLSEKKARQDEIKDKGGFVGGTIHGGRRKSGSITTRQLVTLDADSVSSDIWDDFKLLYGAAGCIYSTHKHAPEKPRLRLIIPLDRQVTPDQYQAISRRIAEALGIDNFDHTTFQPERLMYWPSTSKDGVYLFDFNDDPWLSADEILATYHDWTDASQWPVCSVENEVVERMKKKQGDPLDKKGIVGAFCRSYTIHEAIDQFLGDVYDSCDVPDRYTYKEGSTGAGLITYDDKFAYSHHGTDPISGKLCNAFDLVRIHKFGLKDEDCDPGTPINKLPSYVAMQDFASSQPDVRVQIANEKADDARIDFQTPADITDDDEWKKLLTADRKGNFYPTIDNLVLMLENDVVFKNNIGFDEFEQQAMFRRYLPWRKVTPITKYFTDRDDDNIEHYLEKKYGISAVKLPKALSVIYERTSFHPVRNYLNSVKWDGQSRLETFLIDYMGAEDNEYVRAVSKKSIVGAVARIYHPGIKFDYVLTLVGPEGKGKSTIFNKLGKQWFSDSFNLHMLKNPKQAFEQLRGVWIIEIGELSGMAKAEVEQVKGFISAKVDRYRQSYGYRTEIFPRQCLFFATTNKLDFLRSQTGNRRFWPVVVHVNESDLSVFRDLTDSEIDQLWAEAVHMFKKGEPLFLEEHLESQAVAEQKKHTEEHPWSGIIEGFLEKLLPENWDKKDKWNRIQYLHNPDELTEKGTVQRDRVCIHELWVEALQKRETIDDYSASIVRNIMRNLEGWQEKFEPTRYGIYGLQRRGFVRKNSVTNHVTKALQDVTENDIL